jgi:hypothetical protein
MVENKSTGTKGGRDTRVYRQPAKEGRGRRQAEEKGFMTT